MLFIIVNANSGQDLTAQTNTVIVGQQMSWYCQLSVTNQYMTNFPLANFQWTVPGYAISNYVVAADASSAMAVTNFPLNNSNVVFYWVDGATNRVVQCSAMVQGKTITAQATFNVLRPTAEITATGGTVGLDNFYSFPYNTVRLHCGVPSVGYVGMLFVPSVTMPTNYSGHTNLEWIQEVTYLGRVCLTNGICAHKNVSPLSLDTSCPYGFNANPPNTDDSPTSQNLAGFDQVSYSEDFTMWLMFMPDGGQWVPLRKVNWHWDGAGSLGTNWVLTSSHDPGNPSDTNSFDHPQWDWNAADTNHFQWITE